MHLNSPWWLILPPFIIFLPILYPFFQQRYFLGSFEALVLLLFFITANVTCVFLHEYSHGLILKKLLNDTPNYRLFYCIPQKEVPISIFLIDLVSPFWIVGVWGIFVTYLSVYFPNSPLTWLGIFIVVLQLVFMSKDLYWFILLLKVPDNWYVKCVDGKFCVYKPKL